MSNEVFLLDWNADLLLGYGDAVCAEAVDSLRKSIRRGEEITPVVVNTFLNPLTKKSEDLTGIADTYDSTPINGRIYALNPFVFSVQARARDGGHHRAMAHYLEEKPLPCRWQNEWDELVLTSGASPLLWRFIYELKIESDRHTEKGKLEWEIRKKHHGYSK